MALQVTRPTPPGWPRISASLAYKDPVRAIDWLVAAFGFSVRIKVPDGAGGHPAFRADLWRGGRHGGR